MGERRAGVLLLQCMGLLETLEALERIEKHRNEQLKNYGDVEALLRSNPFLGALFHFLMSLLSRELIAELRRMMPPAERKLLNYEDVSHRMEKTVGAVRQMKARGQIEVEEYREGQPYFTEAAVEKAKREAELRT